MTLGIAMSAGAVWPAIPVPLAIAGWALTGLGMGLLYSSLSVVLLSLSPPAQQGAHSSALQLSEAFAVAAMLALAGALFAALLTSATRAAYLSVFAVACLLAVASFFVARRMSWLRLRRAQASKRPSAEVANVAWSVGCSTGLPCVA
ncbi:MFS transporter [Xanthomonas oryzae]|nr:MFS transporter [Xanthomonas oryzae pv. oryzicola]KOR48323.1 MFS transporter [Xanthomonas oryzae]AKO05346.1 MFS transporter [Xanthomonas oryzae pv. oryzicola]AKO09233.1 MFS transporter [Xanthomonas oryzae pv. oryzicola]OWB21641.1 MFS transporter [Xanthomonas oryzae pv. oryzicola]